MARRRVALCWAPGCDARLAVVDGWWSCPKGHHLRDMTPWLRDHIAVLQGDPGLTRRVFGDLT